MTNQHNIQTREQMRREKIKTALMAAALIVLWGIVSMLAIRTWAEHPGEQPVSYTEHYCSMLDGMNCDGD